MSIEVERGEPAESGAYVAYVNQGQVGVWANRMFMTYRARDKAWFYHGSDRQFRGEVFGWIGPLPAVRNDQ